MQWLYFLIASLYAIVASLSNDDILRDRFMYAYYSNSHLSLFNVTNNTAISNTTSFSNDTVLIKMKPAPLPFPPDHPPSPPVIDITVYENQLYALDGFAYQKFGQQVASVSNVVAISSNSAGSQSKVYLYEELTISESFQYGATGSVSSPTTKQDGYGASIALSDEILFVGAPLDNTGGYSSGKVYVYEAKGLHQPLLTLTSSSGVKKGALFGQSLAVYGTILAVGAPGYPSEQGKSIGAVHLLDITLSVPTLSISESTLLLPPSASFPSFGQFGSALQLQQDFLAVSAVADSSTVVNGGAVYLYSYTPAVAPTKADDDESTNATFPASRALTSDGEWVNTQRLQLDSATSYAYFGRSIAFRGSMGLIAAYNDGGSGVVHVYTKDTADMWSLNNVLLPTDATDSYNNFGSSLYLYLGTTEDPSSAQPVIAVVGSSGDSTFNEMAGAIYVFGVKNANDRITFLILDKLTNNDSAAFDEYGISLATTDSGNVLVGAVLADSTVSFNAGVVYIENSLIPYYLEMVSNVIEESESDDGGSSNGSLSQLVRDALLSTVGIVLLAVVPLVTVGGIVGIVALRGGFAKHRYQSTAQSVDAHGNLLDKDGNVIENGNGSSERSGKNSMHYAYFVNPLRRSKVVQKPSLDMQSVSSSDGASGQQLMGKSSTDLDILYAPVDIHSTIRSPLNSDHTIYPSPIAIPARSGARDVTVPVVESV